LPQFATHWTHDPPISFMWLLHIFVQYQSISNANFDISVPWSESWFLRINLPIGLWHINFTPIFTSHHHSTTNSLMKHSTSLRHWLGLAGWIQKLTWRRNSGGKGIEKWEGLCTRRNWIIQTTMWTRDRTQTKHKRWRSMISVPHMID
jgi:hypothetical protein